MAILIGLNSCSKSQVPEDNSRPFPRNNSVGLRFINETGEDASDIIDMKLTETNTTFPNNPLEYYEMVSENYSYRCLIDGNEVPPTFKINGEGMPIESIIKIEISKSKADKYKIFWLVINSVYIIHNDINSDRLYEFDYKFKLPSLFGEKENSLKVVMKAKYLGKKTYEKVTFNGKEISHDNSNIFDIVINEMRK